MRESYVEHDGAKVMIAELHASSPDDTYYNAKMTVLSEEIKHHSKEDEKPRALMIPARSNGHPDAR